MNIDNIAIEVKTCKCCKEPINFDNVFTENGKKEVEISGVCEVCFDNMFLTQEMIERIEKLADEYDVVGLALETEGVYIAGGIMRKAIDTTDEVMDIDVFFKNIKAAEEFKQKLKQIGYNEVFACPLGELYTYKRGEDVKVQLITKFFYNSLEELVDSFDITACCAGTTDGSDFYSHRRFFTDVLNKNIYLNTITYPVATLNRITKYVRKGYTLSATANIQFIETVNEVVLDENNMVYYVD